MSPTEKPSPCSAHARKTGRSPEKRLGRYHPPVFALLGILQVIIAIVLIFLILLHSGKDAGLSGAFGIGGGGSSFGGGSMVERNLDRATVFFAVAVRPQHLRAAEGSNAFYSELAGLTGRG